MNKFYPLETNEWLEASEELKLSELRVLYYLRTLDPFGQHPVKFRVIDLAESLKCSKGTISKAIQKLGTLGYINLEIVEAIATLTTKAKKFPTGNQVSHPKQPTENIGFPQETKFPTGNIGFPQETSTSYRKPNKPQSGSEQDADLSKINIDQLRKDQLDRSNDFSNFSNANPEISQVEIAPENQKIDKAKISGLKPVKDIDLTETPKKAIAPVTVDSPCAKIEDFVISKLHLEFSSPERRKGYFDKFTTENWDKWKFEMKPVASQPIDQRDPVADDPWRVENAIASMVKCKDFEAVENKINSLEKTNPVLANQLREKYL